MDLLNITIIILLLGYLHILYLLNKKDTIISHICTYSLFLEKRVKKLEDKK